MSLCVNIYKKVGNVDVYHGILNVLINQSINQSNPPHHTIAQWYKVK